MAGRLERGTMKPIAAGWKQILLVVAAILFNAVLLAQTVGGSSFRVSQAFAVPYSDGDPCSSPSQCSSGFCSSGVCCNLACNGPGQNCAVPGSEGTCIREAQSPVLSLPFKAVAAGLAALIAGLRLRRRRLRS